jgi:hypothetical protein
VEVFCYSTGGREDEVTVRLRAAAHGWRSLAVLDDDAAAAQIRADRIDILVDLAGHTAGNRLLVFARKPAPIQVTWLGNADSSGLAAMDYLLADPFVVPSGDEHLYTERVARLPDAYLVYEPLPGAPEVTRRPARAVGEVTLGCFNNLAKVTSMVVETWARILRELPQASLLLKTPALDDPQTRERYLRLFGQHGVSAEQLRLVGRTEQSQLLAQYGEVDLALDPFPYNGCITSLEGLWMGAPLLTLAGDRFVGRVGGSFLTTLGLPELIASTLDDYVAKAVALANTPERLAELRDGLRQRMASSPLGKRARFAEGLEAWYRLMWERWCDGQRVPTPPVVPPATPVTGLSPERPDVSPWAEQHRLQDEARKAAGPYPAERYTGRGIVIVASGARHFANAWVALSALRRTVRCKLPVEVWYLGPDGMSAEMIDLLRGFEVECVDAYEVRSHYPVRRLWPWECKPYAMLHSRFQEVLLLDADVVPLRDPTELFATDEYRRSGAIFWADVGEVGPESAIWEICRVPYRAEPAFQGGVALIDKARCWQALNLTMHLNEWSDVYYQHLHGDKDTFHLAWRMLDQPYGMPPHHPKSPNAQRGGERHSVFDLLDAAGRPIFHHRIGATKWAAWGENLGRELRDARLDGRARRARGTGRAALGLARPRNRASQRRTCCGDRGRADRPAGLHVLPTGRRSAPDRPSARPHPGSGQHLARAALAARHERRDHGASH